MIDFANGFDIPRMCSKSSVGVHVWVLQNDGSAYCDHCKIRIPKEVADELLEQIGD